MNEDIMSFSSSYKHNEVTIGRRGDGSWNLKFKNTSTLEEKVIEENLDKDQAFNLIKVLITSARGISAKTHPIFKAKEAGTIKILKEKVEEIKVKEEPVIE